MPPIADRLTAAIADRYRLERELGQGGMATVVRRRRLFAVADYVVDPAHATYAIARDGRTFYFPRIPRDSSTTSRLVLIRNWFTELRPTLERR